MPSYNPPISLQSYAFQLRRKLLKGAALNELLDIHHQHQFFIEQSLSKITLAELSFSERFAWKFIREINILNTNFSQKSSDDLKADKDSDNNSDRSPSSGQPRNSLGIHQDLLPIVQSVKDIWFPDMSELPNIGWLKQFSTRKLAHYAKNNDEIAFSLIFDFLEVPAEILSYLAYHELLHRQIGTKHINGRRFAHTPDFKNQEHLFPNWHRIDKLIESYILSTN